VEPVRRLAERYRGERLEQEIPPFRAHAFRRFFQSLDPVGEGLPVEQLIDRVARRWNAPTRVQLHSRLMIGRAMNKAWDACSKALGVEKAFRLIRWAGCAYNHYMTLAAESQQLSAREGMRIQLRFVDPADPAFHPLTAMLDETYWASLPEYLRLWIRGEVVFNQ
jgi:hypothetical protein